MSGRHALRSFALGYLALLLVAPVGMVFYRAFEHGASAVLHALTMPDALHALWLTVQVTVIAVVANTVFGVACTIALVRHRFPGRAIVPIHALDLVWGFGTLHCMTQQEPA